MAKEAKKSNLKGFMRRLLALFQANAVISWSVSPKLVSPVPNLARLASALVTVWLSRTRETEQSVAKSQGQIATGPT
jgi:hypothetical protein